MGKEDNDIVHFARENKARQGKARAEERQIAQPQPRWWDRMSGEREVALLRVLFFDFQ